MDSTSKARVERRRVKGAFFGGDKQVGQWQNKRDPKEQSRLNRQRSAKSTDEIFSEGYANAGLSGNQGRIRNVQAKFEDKERAASQAVRNSAVGRTVRNTAAIHLRNKRKKKASISAKAWSRAKVTAANGWIVAWVMFWYVTVQLPFAIISTAGLGIAAMVLSYMEYIRESSTVGRFLIQGIEALASIGLLTFSSIADALEEIMFFFTGIRVNPLALFAIPFIVLFGLGLLGAGVIRKKRA